MHFCKKFGILVLVMIFLIANSNTLAVTSYNLPVPIANVLGKPMGGIYSPSPGTWYRGSAKPGCSLDKLPIVFVQGRRQKAQSWFTATYFYGKNDIYDRAYNSGYRTAFVELNDSTGRGGTQWDNGKILAKQLRAIYDYFGQKVNVVGFSKGGVDVQTALVYYGAHKYVNKVLTLGSPHYGTVLADLGHSWYAKWISSLLGMTDESSECMQTANMAKFRQDTDKRPESTLNQYYTASGTFGGPFPLSIGGKYLSSYGASDGIVNEWSTDLPKAKKIFSKYVDHDKIRTGEGAFKEIDALFGEPSQMEVKAVSLPVSVQPKAENYVYGDKLIPGKPYVHRFIVDSSDEIAARIFTKSPNTQINLVSPSGKVYPRIAKQTIIAGDMMPFAKSTSYLFEIKNPEVGEWKASISSPDIDAFLMLVDFPAKNLQINIPGVVSKQHLAQMKSINVARVTPSTLSITSKIITPDGKMTNRNLYDKSKVLLKRSSSLDINFAPLLKKTGLYNLTFEITGKNQQGQVYKRTIIRSIFLDK